MPQSVMACKGNTMTNGTYFGLDPMPFQVHCQRPHSSCSLARATVLRYFAL